MASLNSFLFGIVILLINVNAAPSDVSKIEEIAKVETADPKLDLQPRVETVDPKLDSQLSVETVDPKLDVQPKELENDTSATETQRQKRWYNPYGYGFPPINPLIYPTYNKRDEGPNTNFYGGEDPIAQIHRRVQEIANIVRQPPIPPPPIPQIPIFYPILFIPPGDCRCYENPISPSTDNNSSSDNNQTSPDINNRWPDMEDERQNWGLVVDNDTDDDTDFSSRPISFDPIKIDRPIRPPPPVEHGSVQSGSTDGRPGQPQSTPSSQSPPTPSAPPPQNRPQTSSPPQNRPANSFTPQNRPQNRPPGLAPPSACDGAILTCCHQPQVTYDCFAIQGCPDFTAYGNPCDSNLILRIIERFQTFYGQKTG